MGGLIFSAPVALIVPNGGIGMVMGDRTLAAQAEIRVKPGQQTVKTMGA